MRHVFEEALKRFNPFLVSLETSVQNFSGNCNFDKNVRNLRGERNTVDQDRKVEENRAM